MKTIVVPIDDDLRMAIGEEIARRLKENPLARVSLASIVREALREAPWAKLRTAAAVGAVEDEAPKAPELPKITRGSTF